MKTKISIERSRAAALKSAHTSACQIAMLLTGLQNGSVNPADAMPMVRPELAELNQRVHEFNALDNVLRTT